MKDNKIMATLHKDFVASCSEYAGYIAQHSAFGNKLSSESEKSSKDTKVENNPLNDVRSSIMKFLDMRYNKNIQIEEISLALDIRPEILLKLEEVIEEMILLQKTYWINMLTSIINGEYMASEEESVHLMKFISIMSKDDIAFFGIDEVRFKIFSALFQKAD